MKRNKMEESKFDPDITIHTPIESLYQFYETHIVLKNVNDDILSRKILRSEDLNFPKITIS